MNNINSGLFGPPESAAGILLPLLMMVPALIVLFVLWRLWQGSQATARELRQVSDKLDRLCADLERRPPGAAPEATGPVAAPRPPAPEPVQETAAPEPAGVIETPFDLPLPPATLPELAEDFDFGAVDLDLPADGGNDLQAETAGFPMAETEAAGFAPDPETEELFQDVPPPTWTAPADGFAGQEPDEQAIPTPVAAPAATVPPPAPPAESMAAAAPAVVKLPGDPQRPATLLARCGGCGHKLAYKEALAGKRVKCPACQQAFVLP